MRIGVDLGGTKIEIVALDGHGRELVRRRVSSPAHSYEAIVEAIGSLVESVAREVGPIDAVGVGTPGAVSPPSRVMKNANSTVLIGRPLERDLALRLGRQVRLENDANCFTLSEAVDGAGAGAAVVFGVILGTGVGGGITVGGRILTGRNAIAGEWGHNSLPWARKDDEPAPQCYCGKRGCIETYLSGPGFAADCARRGGGAQDARRIAELAARGDAIAREALAAYADRLARGLASVINVVDPDVIVLGGGLSNIDALLELVPAALPKHVFSDVVGTRVVRAAHGDSSGVRGAAWLW